MAGVGLQDRAIAARLGKEASGRDRFDSAAERFLHPQLPKLVLGIEGAVDPAAIGRREIIIAIGRKFPGIEVDRAGAQGFGQIDFSAAGAEGAPLKIGAAGAGRRRRSGATAPLGGAPCLS